VNSFALVGARHFETIQLQATLFTPDLAAEASQADSPLVSVLSEWFTDDPVVLPFPPSAPRDFPRLILSAQDGVRRCEVAPGRVSIFSLAPVPANEDHVRPFLTDVTRAFQAYRDAAQTRVDRLAYVITRFAPSKHPERALAQHYLGSQWSKSVEPPILTFELNLHQTLTLDGFSVNVWNRNSNSLAEVAGEHVQGIVVEQDVNTVVVDGFINYTQDDIIQFYSVVESATNQMLTQFYPEGGDYV
jgi:hypothetical protein